jgi:hypothetical protein
VKRFTRVSFFVVALTLGIAGFVYADPELAETWGLDFWNYSRLDQELSDYDRISARLSASQEQTRWRIEYRDQLVEELFQGRATIDQIIRQFQALNQSAQTPPETLRLLFRTDDDRRVATQQLLQYLEGHLQNGNRYASLKAEVKNLLVTEYGE